jgi:hypothetical protein
MVPATTAGRWCLASFTFGVLSFITMMVSLSSGQEGGDTFTDNWWISGPALVAALGLVVAFATGLFAIVGSQERGRRSRSGHGDRSDRDALHGR